MGKSHKEISFKDEIFDSFAGQRWLYGEGHQAIDLLQQRRTALISAAVTGQIDVRNNLN